MLFRQLQKLHNPLQHDHRPLLTTSPFVMNMLIFGQVWDEGTSELHMAGLYHNVQETLKALKFRPPGHLFDNAYDPHTFQYLGV